MDRRREERLAEFQRIRHGKRFPTDAQIAGHTPSTNDTFTDNPDHYNFNQMFNLSLSNQFGVECWNSYTNGFELTNDSMVIYVRDSLRHAALSNDESFSADLPVFPMSNSIAFLAGNVWPGYNLKRDPLGSLLSFQIPLNTNVIVITNSVYRFNVGNTTPEPGFVAGHPYLTTNLASPYEENVMFNNNQLYPQPHWFLTTSNELQVFMLETSPSGTHVIDYVQLSGPNTTRDLTSEIITNYDAPVISVPGQRERVVEHELSKRTAHRSSQSDRYITGELYGQRRQRYLDQSSPSLLANEIAGFNAFFGYTPPPPYVPGEVQAIATAQMTNAMQTPYTPTATVVQHVSWQANDPLVHYTASDLNWGLNGESSIISDRYVDTLTNNSPNGNLGALNQSYRPWGGNPLPGVDSNPYNLALKDPLVWQSDDWDFPSYKMPTVGWLGRVHRGTPWQSVYLKAPDILQEIQVTVDTKRDEHNQISRYQLLDGFDGKRQSIDAANTAPTQDRLLFDIFTTAPTTTPRAASSRLMSGPVIHLRRLGWPPGRPCSAAS